jgi:molecular chaperone DnaK (HSP70)
MVRNQIHDNGKNKYSNVLVFDMGGGTTDVTIVQLVKKRSAYSEDEKITTGDEKVQGAHYRERKETVECRVIATSGDVALGGDDIDELLTQWFLSHDGTPTDVSKPMKEARNNVEHRELRRTCCRAKEDLCGDGKDQESQKFVFIEHGTKRVKLSMEMFEHIIEQVIRRAEETINLALLSFLEHVKSKGKEGDEDVSRDDSEKISAIDEVVLVGGNIYKKIHFILSDMRAQTCFQVFIHFFFLMMFDVCVVCCCCVVFLTYTLLWKAAHGYQLYEKCYGKCFLLQIHQNYVLH